MWLWKNLQSPWTSKRAYAILQPWLLLFFSWKVLSHYFESPFHLLYPCFCLLFFVPLAWFTFLMAYLAFEFFIYLTLFIPLASTQFWSKHIWLFSWPIILIGSPAEPRCGFSRQIVDILRQERILYSSFDILTDDEVRQELKAFANWPTFPQLWIQGELMGGLDIVREMVTSGDLQSMVPPEAKM